MKTKLASDSSSVREATPTPSETVAARSVPQARRRKFEPSRSLIQSAPFINQTQFLLMMMFKCFSRHDYPLSHNLSIQLSIHIKASMHVKLTCFLRQNYAPFRLQRLAKDFLETTSQSEKLKSNIDFVSICCSVAKSLHQKCSTCHEKVTAGNTARNVFLPSRRSKTTGRCEMGRISCSPQ